MKVSKHTWLVTRVVSIFVLCLVTSIFVLCMGLWYWFDWSEGVIQRTAVSPTGQITALVIGDDCGATCHCKIRVDLHMAGRAMKEVYRSYGACDAELTWLSATELRIVDVESMEHKQGLLDMKKLGLVP